MRFMRFILGLSLLATANLHAAALVPLESFTRADAVVGVSLSPTGEYLAITRQNEDRTALIVVRLADRKQVGGIHHEKDSVIHSVQWATDDRLLYSLSMQMGYLAQPQGLGQIYGMNVDGSRAQVLAGRGSDALRTIHGAKRDSTSVSAYFVDRLHDRPGEVLVEIRPWMYADDVGNRELLAHSTLERMDIVNGRRSVVARAPVANANFSVDARGQARFANGQDLEGRSKLFYRDGEDGEWILVNDQAKTSLGAYVIGFSADGATAYLRTHRRGKADAIEAFDTATRARRVIAADDDSDPWEILYSPYDETPFGVVFMDGLPRTEYFDADSREARLHRSLQKSFPGLVVSLGRATAGDGKGLFVVRGDRVPGDVYLFDYAAKRADFLMAYRQEIDPQQMAARKPVSLAARDGLPLRGYLTLPNGSDGKHLPLVIHPHGGPMGLFDDWLFDGTPQLLASRGYAVLQVNFRGSGNHGRDFELAGHRQWGRTMQDDLTDATRWAIAEGIADPARICIFGASYGGYAALMGAAREPDLYQCAIGDVGVYDLEMMYREDTSGHASTAHYMTRTLGAEGLAEISPNRLASKIRIPVLLTAGEEDTTAPPAHTRRMRDALEKAGVPVETEIYRQEGHGLYKPENRIDFYTRVLAFLEAHIGKGEAGGAP